MMFSPCRLSIVRLSVMIVLSFSLNLNVVPLTRTAEAESQAPSQTAIGVQPIIHRHRNGELIVKFKDGIPQRQRELIARTFGKEERRLRGPGSIEILMLKDGEDPGLTHYKSKNCWR